MTTNSNRRLASLLIAVALVAAGCSSGTSGSGESFDALTSQSEGATRDVRPYQTIQEAVEYVTDRHETEGANHLVVVGRVTAVEPGVSFKWELTDDGADRIDLPFGDPEAETNTVHLIIETSEELAPHQEKGPAQRTVGLLFSPEVDLKTIQADFLGLGETVMFLGTSGAFDYQPGVYSVMENSLFIGSVSDDGIVTFPLFEKDDPLVGDSGTVTLDQLGSDR